jgi:hypothetical protein
VLDRALDRTRGAEQEIMAVCHLVTEDPLVRREAARVRMSLTALDATLVARMEMFARHDEIDLGGAVP